MSRIAAVILAGGKGERLGGVNKALIEIGGIRLVDRALAAVRGCDPVLLSVGESDFDLPGPVHILETAGQYSGPLAGISASVGQLRHDPPDFLLSLAVDTPFFPADFAERALALIGDAPAVLAAYAGQAYPTNALWRFAAISGLPDAVEAGTAPHSLKRLAAALGAVFLDYAGIAPEDPFLNANTPAELAFLRARAPVSGRG